MEQTPHHTAWEGKFLRVRVCGNWEYVERVNSPAGVVIIAVTPEGNLLLTEQYRVPLRRKALELPAGLAGDEHYGGEPLVEAARRELREETGYEAGDWELLGGGPPSAGLSNEQVYFFRARQLRRAGPGGGAGDERIETREVPVHQAGDWLAEREREGLAVDPRIYAALYFLQRENSQR